jgi:hypothetical protein
VPVASLLLFNEAFLRVNISLGYKVPVAENSFQTIVEYINYNPLITCRFPTNGKDPAAKVLS